MNIRRKLLALMLTLILVPVSSVLALVARKDIRDIRAEMLSSSSLMASVVAEYGAAAMAFVARAAAEQALEALGHRDEVLDAALYDRSGTLFAAYLGKGPPPPDAWDPKAPLRAEIEGDRITVVRAVDHGGERFGTLVLHTSTEPLTSRVHAYLWGLFWLAIGLLVASLMSAWALEWMVSRRLDRLADVARGVARKGDYSVRAKDQGGDEIGLLASAFNHMLGEVQRRQEEAEKAVRVRDEFLSVASHELKTPLTSLKLQVQSLLEMPPEVPEGAEAERLKASFALTERQVRRLERLIGNLLDVSRIAVGRFQLQLEEVDLVAVVRDVTTQFSAEIGRARVQVDLRLPPAAPGRWDPLRLEQVVVNLLSNALKYGNGKPIEIAVEVQDGLTRLKVRDGGIGIAAENQVRIFERFERAVSLNYGGLGLGLFIAKQIVVAHGGIIRVESALGSGATFAVELPRGNA
jgi:signal transduction histidine kinase